MAYAPTLMADPQPLQLGEKFCSYEHLKQRLEEHKLATMTDYSSRDGRTLSKAVSKCPRALTAPQDLKYYYLKVMCIYGGQFYKSKRAAKSNRKFVGTFRQGCPAQILFTLTKDCQHLCVKKLNDNHNHSMNPSILRLKPGSSAAKARRKNEDHGLQSHAKSIVHDGFVYNKVPHAKNGKQYLKCVVDKCPGRAIKLTAEDGSNSVSLTKPHLHAGDNLALQRLQFMAKMKARAEKEATSLTTIFQQECLNFPEISNEADFTLVSPILEASRRKASPDPPKMLRELGFLLVSEEWRFRFGCTLQQPPQELFVGVVQGQGGETGAVFASLYLCSIMNTSLSEMHIDTSYKNLPDKPNDMKCLLSLHFVQDGHSFAAVYATMSGRSLSACLAVLTFVRDELLPDCMPKVIFTGFEAELQLACREVFPTADVQGSCVYYSKDVWAKFDSLRLLELPFRDQLLSMVRSLMCLPLLPAALMEAGLNAVAASLAHLSSPIPLQLVAHVRHLWLDAVGPHDISAHENPARSNFTVQSFHQELEFWLAQTQPDAWGFVEALQRLEQNQRHAHQALLHGREVAAVRRAPLVVEEPSVNKAAAQLSAGEIRIMEFLAAASPFVAQMTSPLAEDTPLPTGFFEQADDNH